MSFNLAVVLRESAKSHPDKAAIIAEEGDLTYATLDVASDVVAANLVAQGLRPGDAVGIQLPNVPSSPSPSTASSRPAPSRCP